MDAKDLALTVGLAAGGVIVAGLVMAFAKDQDIPYLKDASRGFSAFGL